MICKKCKKEIDEGSIFCKFCGRKQTTEKTIKKRGNGQGSVYKLPNSKYQACITCGYYLQETVVNGEKTIVRKRNTFKRTFDTKTEAINALNQLRIEKENQEKTGIREITFKGLYDLWLPTHKKDKGTIGCYSAAMNHFKSIWAEKIRNIDIEDLQECLDTCGCGKRTKENMKALCGLMYKYGIPRRYIPRDLNLSPFLDASGEAGKHRISFTEDQIEQIRKQIGKTFGAEYIYCLIYLGFRPTEYVTLKKENYDIKNQIIVAGMKTDAGKDRTVTVSPKIQPYMKAMYDNTDSYLVKNPNGYAYDKDNFPELMYSVLEAAGIDNPMIESAGRKVHLYTPHSCRHTFATLMKRVQADSKDKQELIGHASDEMLRYYQDVSVEDLRFITDRL